MFITAVTSWAKSLAEKLKKPQTYGSALEAYIVSHDPKDSCDVDRLTREFDNKMTNRWSGGFPC